MLGLLSPFIFAQMLNVIQKGGPDMIQNILPYALFMLFSPFVDRAFYWPARIMERQLAFEATKSYKMSLYHAAISLPMQWHTDHHTGTTIDKISKATNALEDFANSIFTNMGTFISLIGALIALWIILPWIIIVLFVSSFIVFSIVTYYDKKIVSYIKKINRLDHKINSLLVDYISNIRTLITLRFLSPTERTIEAAIQDTYVDRVKEMKATELKWFGTYIILDFTLYGILLWYIYYSRSLTGAVLVGTIIMIYQYTQRVAESFYNFTHTYSKMVQAVANSTTVEDIEQAYDMITITHNNYDLKKWKKIKLQSIDFDYDHKKIFSKLNFSFKRSEKIAFVGESGSGKSTLLSLLRGLHEPSLWILHITQQDGTKEIFQDLDPLYSITSLIPQDPEIFEDTIAFNITIGSEVTPETVKEYSLLARFHDVVKWLPHGYESNIKEKGVNLSGWQKQRLALARGLLASQNSDIILLDESTSSVDSINEKKIYTNILEQFKEKTIIAAIHKLHLLTLFDTIYVFDEGKIKESGSFHDLIEQWGMLANMRTEYQASQKKNK